MINYQHFNQRIPVDQLFHQQWNQPDGYDDQAAGNLLYQPGGNNDWCRGKCDGGGNQEYGPAIKMNQGGSGYLHEQRQQNAPYRNIVKAHENWN